MEQEQGGESLLAVQWTQDVRFDIAVNEVEWHLGFPCGGAHESVEEAFADPGCLVVSPAVTLGTKNLDDAVAVYVKRMQALPIHDGIDDAERCRFQILQLGDCLLRLAEPLDQDSPLGEHVAKWGNAIYSITLRVRDVDSAEAWLAKKDVRTTRLRDDLLAADPDDCHGAPYFFTTAGVPGDPFES